MYLYGIIRIFHECEVLIEKSVPRVTVWQHKVLTSIAKLYPRARFLDQYLTLMIDSCSCTPMGIDTRIKIKLTLKYFAFASAILISTIFCDVMFNDKVK